MRAAQCGSDFSVLAVGNRLDMDIRIVPIGPRPSPFPIHQPSLDVVACRARHAVGSTAAHRIGHGGSAVGVMGIACRVHRHAEALEYAFRAEHRARQQRPVGTAVRAVPGGEEKRASPVGKAQVERAEGFLFAEIGSRGSYVHGVRLLGERLFERAQRRLLRHDEALSELRNVQLRARERRKGAAGKQVFDPNGGDGIVDKDNVHGPAFGRNNGVCIVPVGQFTDKDTAAVAFSPVEVRRAPAELGFRHTGKGDPAVISAALVSAAAQAMKLRPQNLSAVYPAVYVFREKGLLYQTEEAGIVAGLLIVCRRIVPERVAVVHCVRLRPVARLRARRGGTCALRFARFCLRRPRAAAAEQQRRQQQKNDDPFHFPSPSLSNAVQSIVSAAFSISEASLTPTLTRT